MNNIDLEEIINRKLKCSFIKDFVPNGLQIEGKEKIFRIITGISICQRLLNIAIAYQADAIIVHHGFFWKNESPRITGVKRRRIKKLLSYDINLYAWHIPLDIHPKIGNNSKIAEELGIEIDSDPKNILSFGTFPSCISSDLFLEKLKIIFGSHVSYYKRNSPKKIKKIAWCSGNGDSFLEKAAKEKVDAFISGEISEKSFYLSEEYGINFFVAGHSATEKVGMLALSEWLANRYNLEVSFIDFFNPI